MQGLVRVSMEQGPGGFSPYRQSVTDTVLGCHLFGFWSCVGLRTLL